MTRKFDPVLVEYEESDRKQSWVYRFDHERIEDGSWHRLNSVSNALYRIRDDHLQYRSPSKYEPLEDTREVFEFLANLEPFGQDLGCVEIWIGKDEEGFFARDFGGEIDGPRATGMSELSAEEFKRAFDTIAGM